MSGTDAAVGAGAIGLRPAEGAAPVSVPAQRDNPGEPEALPPTQVPLPVRPEPEIIPVPLPER
jgi:hypothetical protein